MKKLADLVGLKIGDGWSVERWYEVKVYWKNRNNSGFTSEYYNNLKAAQTAGIMAGKDGADVVPKELFILTHDGKTGFSLSTEIKASPKSLSEIEAAKLESVMDNLSPLGQELVLTTADRKKS
jgi:hypothetical protein